MYEMWKWKEILNAIEWGQLDYEEEEITWADFKGIYWRSPVDDSKEMYFPYHSKIVWLLITISINLVMLAILCGIIAGMIELRIVFWLIWSDKGSTLKFLSTTIPSVVNTVVIMIFNQIYAELAYWLTNFENHKTYTTYERALIIKTFIF